MDLSSTETWRWIWLGLGVFFSVAEIVVAGTFFLLPFGVGAFAAAIVAFATASVTAAWVVFVATSVVAFATLVPLGRRLDRTAESRERVGANRWEGRVGVVLDEIPEGPGATGLVRVDREEWRAESSTDGAVKVGSRVLVLRVDGTRLVVEPVADQGGQDAPVRGGR